MSSFWREASIRAFSFATLDFLVKINGTTNFSLYPQGLTLFGEQINFLIASWYLKKNQVSLGYICLTRSDDNEENNIFYGLITCALVVGVPISIMLFPNGPFTRPHPILWRIVFGGLLCYMLALVFMLFCSMSQSNDFTVIPVLKFEFSSPRNDLHWSFFERREKRDRLGRIVRRRLFRHLARHHLGLARHFRFRSFLGMGNEGTHD